MSTFDSFNRQLAENGFEDVVATLHDEEIDNETLSLLTEDMMGKIGISPLGKRLKVMNILNKIRSQEGHEIAEEDATGSLVADKTPLAPCEPVATKAEHVDVDTEKLSLPTPLPYPPFSPMVLKEEETNTILLLRAQLIRESARFYVGLKYDLSNDYNTICQHLIKRFPDLKDPISLPGCSCNYTKLKKDLAQSVRNHKRPIDKKRRTTANIVSNAKEINVEDTGYVPGVTIDQNLLERTLKELKKESIKNKPSKVHIKQLLTAAADNYIEFVNTSPTIDAILDTYPVLNNPCWIVFQAGLMIKFPEFEEEVSKRIDLLLTSIANIMGGTIDDEGLTEAKKLTVLEYMEHMINGQKNTPVFMVIKPGQCLESSISAPSLITTQNATAIGQAFLCVDAIQICEVTNPSVVGLLTLWLATHYVFNIVYGKENNNVAMVLEDCVLMEKGLNSLQTLSMEVFTLIVPLYY